MIIGCVLVVSTTVEKNNKNQIFIKDCWLCSLYEVVIDRPEVNIVEKIKKARSKDEEVVRVVEEPLAPSPASTP